MGTTLTTSTLTRACSSSALTKFTGLSRLLLIANSALLVSTAQAWTPGVGQEASTHGFSVNTQSRNDVISFWNSVYQKSEGYENRIGWTGSISSGNPGTTSGQFKNDVERRINYFRAMAGMPANIRMSSSSLTVTTDSGPNAPAGTTKQTAAQAAALMLSRNSSEFLVGGGIAANPHNPPSSWALATSTARNAANYSNLAVGKFGPGAIDAYMSEDAQGVGGGENADVGHRRYLLYSRLNQVATGDVPATGENYFPANVLYIHGGLLDPTNSPKFISWPNSGFIPEALVPQRWSLSFPGADFSSASVRMEKNGGNTILTEVVSRSRPYGDSTIVWKPDPASIPSAASQDVTINVSVSNIIINGASTSHSYSVTIINPNRLNQYPTFTGNTSSSDRAIYDFTQLDHAEEYELGVSMQSPVTWTQGAEDSSSGYVMDGTSASYSLRTAFQWDQNGQQFWDSGSKAFRLAFPDSVMPLDNQTFTIDNTVIPQPGASMSFRFCRGYMTAETRLDVQYSDDGGGSWNTLSSFTGNSNGTPDNGFATKNVDLKSIGSKILIRFLLHQPNPTGVYDIISYPDLPLGAFIDNINFTNCDSLQDIAQLKYPKTASYVDLLDITTNGESIVGGGSYTLRIRPKIGTRWMPYGPSIQVVAAADTYWLTVDENTANDHTVDENTGGLVYNSRTGGTGFIEREDLVFIRRGITAMVVDTDIIKHIESMLTYIADDQVISDDNWENEARRKDFLDKLEVVLELTMAAGAAEAAGDFEQATSIYAEASEMVDRDLIIKTDGLQNVGGNIENDWVVKQEAQDIIHEDLIYLSDYLFLKSL